MRTTRANFLDVLRTQLQAAEVCPWNFRTKTHLVLYMKISPPSFQNKPVSGMEIMLAYSEYDTDYLSTAWRKNSYFHVFIQRVNVQDIQIVTLRTCL